MKRSAGAQRGMKRPNGAENARETIFFFRSVKLATVLIARLFLVSLVGECSTASVVSTIWPM